MLDTTFLLKAEFHFYGGRKEMSGECLFKRNITKSSLWTLSSPSLSLSYFHFLSRFFVRLLVLGTPLFATTSQDRKVERWKAIVFTVFCRLVDDISKGHPVKVNSERELYREWHHGVLVPNFVVYAAGLTRVLHTYTHIHDIHIYTRGRISDLTLL